MTTGAKKLVKCWKRFLSAESGSITVEFSLWIPVLLAVMFLGINASILFSAQSNFWNVSRDTARVVSRHAMGVEDAEAYARDRATLGGYVPDVQVSIDEEAGTVVVVITAEVRSLIPFDVTSFALGDTFSVRVSQSMEPI
jgi:Flp pilus assembly protein TadG